MKVTAKMRRAFRDWQLPCAYIMRDGIVIRVRENVLHRGKWIGDAEVAYVARGEIRIEGRTYHDGTSEPTPINGVGFHDGRVTLDGIATIEIAFQNSSLLSQGDGLISRIRTRRVDTLTLETPSGARHRMDNIEHLAAPFFTLSAGSVDALLTTYMPDATVIDC